MNAYQAPAQQNTGYGAPPPTAAGAPAPGGGTQFQSKRMELFFCQQSEPEVSETMGLIIFVLNCVGIIFGPWGTLISSCIDRNGFNANALGIGLLQGLLFAACYLGYAWSIYHGFIIWNNSKGKV